MIIKRIVFAAAIATFVIGSVACIKEESTDNVEAKSFVSIEAVFADKADDTRTALQSDGKSVWWSPKEEISLFYGSYLNGKLVSTNTDPQALVTFNGYLNGTPMGSDNYWAVYPYDESNTCDGSSVTLSIPQKQEAKEGSFGERLFPAIAVSKTQEFAFYNVCGGIKFSVSKGNIKYITFRGNNGEALAGTVRVAFNSDGFPAVTEVIDKKEEITLIAPDGGLFKAGKDYYVTLLPTSLGGGFTMTLIAANERGTIVSNKPQTIKRSVFGALKNIDTKAEWVIPEAVDLGLPSGLKWASCNVGAFAPEEYGDYFAWGETEPKEDYYWSNYKWCNGYSNKLTKYCTQSFYWESSGPMDNKTVLDLEDDAARANWGGSWRMPTYEEWWELWRNCTWTSVTLDGVNGSLGTSNTNGNSIFLPAAGCHYFMNLEYAGSEGDFWSSSLLTYDSSFTDDSRYSLIGINDDFGNVGGSYEGRFAGLTVRPVWGEFVPVTDISLDKTELELAVGQTYTLSATVSPANATAKNVTWISSDPDVVSVHKGEVTAVSKGQATIIAYSSDGSKSAACLVNVTAAIEIDGDFSDWAALKSGSYSECYGNKDSLHPALTYCKVYANAGFIYVYFEYDPDYLNPEPDVDHVPFHCCINTDGNTATGGFVDWFSDACTDVMLEGFIYPDGVLGSYAPLAFAWEGEPNGSGWSWRDLGIEGFCKGAGVEGQYEISIDCAKLASVGFPVADVFSIGFDIQQCWDPVGILPSTAPSEENPSGILPSLEVKVQK